MVTTVLGLSALLSGVFASTALADSGSQIPSPRSTEPAYSAKSDPGVMKDQRVDEFLVAHPDATKVSATEVSWDNGAVVMTWPNNSGLASSDLSTTGDAPDAVGINAYDSCERGWVCLYQARDYEQRKIRFKDCGPVQRLSDYGADNGVSSWSNKTSRSYTAYDSSYGTTTLWAATPNSRSSFVGWSANDRASSIRIFC